MAVHECVVRMGQSTLLSTAPIQQVALLILEDGCGMYTAHSTWAMSRRGQQTAKTSQTSRSMAPENASKANALESGPSCLTAPRTHEQTAPPKQA